MIGFCENESNSLLINNGSRLQISCKINCGFKPLSANPTKWSNTLKQLVDNLPTNCLSASDNFVGWRLKY